MPDIHMLDLSLLCLGPAIDMETWTADWGGEEREIRVEWEADSSTNFFLCLSKSDWLW